MTSLLHRNESTVYPGRFIPMVKEKDVIKEHKKRKDIQVVAPAANIIEKEYSIEIEIAIPGAGREDFFIKINKNKLSVIVLHKTSFDNSSGKYQLHEFDYDFFERDILLPDNADAQLTRAEYKEGILHLYIPKSNYPLQNRACRIVVY